MQDSSAKLFQFIKNEIQRKGPMTFAQYMELCLYHPRYGYYSSLIARQGKKGDYATSPSVHPIFGKMLGKQLEQMWSITGEDVFEIIEMGGGAGYLCHDILGYLKDQNPRFYHQLHYGMVEKSVPAIERQKTLLGPFKEKVFWYNPGELKSRQIIGCFLSNELVDAFPVHRVIMKKKNLLELYVDYQNGKLTEVIGKLSSPLLTEYFQRLNISLQEGQKAEVNIAALRWIETVAHSLKQGFVITIDYGYPGQELYSPFRKDGTLVCYRGHRVSLDPYSHVGLQDMTSHVDFTTLGIYGKKLGLETTGLVPQYKFLFALGIVKEIELLGEGKDEQEAMAERITIKNLILPGGMGDTFKVLIQHKGIDKPKLDGLSEL